VTARELEGATEGETMALALPYFDDLLGQIARTPDSSLAKAFQRHVHWGYYVSPDGADDSLDAYLVAAESMAERVCQAARVRNGLRILDVGCGVGGTIAHMNEHLSGCQFVGLNIEERQLAVARESVKPQSGNTVEFVQGDACAMPFADGQFDVVMAVECIFHFPSRKTFFGEARRVLRPGGTLAVSDFVVDGEKLDELVAWTESSGSDQGSYFGTTSRIPSSDTYARLGRTKGFAQLSDVDITSETMPTYLFLKKLYRDNGIPGGVEGTAYFEETARRGFIQYRVLSFEAAAPR
jgi:ubiquinone/menaquinone biosynthesis C-methylase UbiE